MNRDHHVEAQLPAYLDDRLDAAERARVDAHLESCAACARAADAWRAVERLLDQDEAATPLAPMWPAIARRRDPARRRAADFGFALATAAALAAGFVLGVLALGRGAAAPAAPLAQQATAYDADWLASPERSLSDAYFFDGANGAGSVQ